MSEYPAPSPVIAPEGNEQPASSGGERRLSRRALFTGGAALATLWGEEKRRAFARPDPVSPPEVTADVDPGSLLVRLVRRVTFGFTEAELALALSLGYDGYLEFHLDHESIDDSALQTRLDDLDTLTWTYEQFVDDGNQSLIVNELTEATILRATMSRRQLFERVVEFWTDHFNIDLLNGADLYLKPIDDREVIRPNAMRTFPQLLAASAHSPAMLYYLNNDISTAGNPNENYARELMELHTMGTDGGYTQQDVVEVARCFTGWTWWRRNQDKLQGSFRFNPAIHDNEQKVVLGSIIPAGGGMQDALTVLDILSEHPSTARFIARKMCQKFVGESCPQSVIDHVASVYTQTGGDIKAMLRAIFLPNVQADAAPKYKRPFHQLVSGMRALPTTIISTNALRNQLNGSGHRPFFWGPPDGYPDTLAYWSGLVIPRWNFGASLMGNQLTGVSVDFAAFFSGLTTADQMADRINQGLFGGEMPVADRNRIRDYMLPNTPSAARQREAIGLAIGSPGFQWH